MSWLDRHFRAQRVVAATTDEAIADKSEASKCGDGV